MVIIIRIIENKEAQLSAHYHQLGFARVKEVTDDSTPTTLISQSKLGHKKHNNYTATQFQYTHIDRAGQTKRAQH